jgi:hypothetical protein
VATENPVMHRRRQDLKTWHLVFAHGTVAALLIKDPLPVQQQVQRNL